MLMVTISTNLPLCVAGQTILKNLFSKILVIYIVCVACSLSSNLWQNLQMNFTAHTVFLLLTSFINGSHEISIPNNTSLYARDTMQH